MKNILIINYLFILLFVKISLQEIIIKTEYLKNNEKFYLKTNVQVLDNDNIKYLVTQNLVLDVTQFTANQLSNSNNVFCGISSIGLNACINWLENNINYQYDRNNKPGCDIVCNCSKLWNCYCSIQSPICPSMECNPPPCIQQTQEQINIFNLTTSNSL